MKIKNNAFSVGIWSEDYKKLSEWYENVLKLPVRKKSDLANDSFVGFDFGDNWFWIGQHDKVSGKSKDPYRIMVEFYVESVSEAHKELKAQNVEFIAEPFTDPLAPEKWCMTFKDPEGNILQMYGDK
jgi:predicted enzyme related to lactoylglutathione lyase